MDLSIQANLTHTRLSPLILLFFFFSFSCQNFIGFEVHIPVCGQRDAISSKISIQSQTIEMPLVENYSSSRIAFSNCNDGCAIQAKTRELNIIYVTLIVYSL